MPHVTNPHLLALKDQLDDLEAGRLSPLASLSREGVRRRTEEGQGQDHRQSFAVDGDRVLHSRAYTRYIDKTQVFYMVKNDHITHRVLHVQLVAKIGRTIGRYLRLNEDLIEAIALGHDIGHPPFGHDGEKVLDALCREHGLPSFQHNLQSVRFLEGIERQGRGWNLTLQTLDGIMCHDGEIHNRCLAPQRGKTFADLDRQGEAKSLDRRMELVPMTMEGCVVRFADTIAYIGRDIEDAIELGLIRREDIPFRCQEVFGRTNGSMVYRLVTDLIANGLEDGAIAFSEEVSEGLKELKGFNYERIYLNPAIKKGLAKITDCYRVLFASCLDQFAKQEQQAEMYTNFLNEQGREYVMAQQPAIMVRDFIAGMTDEYFLRQARLLGCEVPEKT
ncbi:MAG: HD domain-containing protein [Desulfobulbaceae bacterium]|nr:HD domain-containing protein [Desulfobulbaceae bacterium]HIJ89979.1 HD domain-containing protein [Deltaproteobacteria bacterium]